MSYEIEKGIPMPQPPGTGSLIATVRKMEIGDSILLAERGPPSGGHLAHIIRVTGYKLTRRKVEGGVRIWRVE